MHLLSLAFPLFSVFSLSWAASSQPFSTVIQKIVTSRDGTTIYSETSGNPTGPQLILAHGFASSHTVFDPLFYDEELLATLQMVSLN